MRFFLPVRLYDTRRFDRAGEDAALAKRDRAAPPADGSVRAVHRSQVNSRSIYKHEMALLLRVAGYRRYEIHGDFDRRPLERENDAMVVMAWEG